MRRLSTNITLAAAVAIVAAACATGGGGGGGGTLPNQDPIAAFTTTPSSGNAPLTVTIDGTFSTDPDGSIVSYVWDFGDGTTGTAPTATKIYPAGTYTVSLTVTDDDGVTDSSTRVVEATPAPPIASFTATPTGGPAPLAVAFNASASADPDGSIVSYAWNFGDGGTAVGVMTNHTFGVGTFTVTLTVTDNSGVTDTETRVFGATNDAPVATFTTTPSSGNRPLAVSLNGTGSFDADGSIASYAWTYPGGTASGSTASVVLTQLGSNLVTLTVTDNNGATNSTTRTVTVNNSGPTASFTTTPSSGSGSVGVAFNASASGDPDGTIVSYVWDFDTAWAFAGDAATGVTTNHTYTAGAYTARLTVTDNNGATATTTRTISVSGAPSAAPTGLHKTGSGCCDTYGDFAWNPVPGADGYEINIDGDFLGGCVTDHSDVTNGQTDHGRVQAVGLCLGSSYDVSIRARANGAWGPWSPSIGINL
ncbi:MAG TPA: PKD domain-containing protein [Microthrixaceae bacterium]|nr:PKD domain-containing protein [Microthrixaceae bacterium]